MSAQTTRLLPMLDPSDPRYRPEARVVRLPQWRTPDGEKPAVFIDSAGEWRVVNPIHVAALETLRDGGTFEDAVQRALHVRGELKENHVRILMRRWFWQLRNEGYLDIPLPEPPEVFAGRYRRVRELGRGGIGIAHLCRDEKTGADVVVKHAWGYLGPIDRADKMMRAENEALKAFDRPGIPRHIEDFERDELLHIAREFVDGEQLAAKVVREGVPAPAERARLMRDAASLVAHMHGRGYLFLDPTPGNFVLRPDGTLAVIDVGICRRHENGLALSHAQAGSRGYAAPEMLDRANIGVWSDVFGLGSLLYYLAAGKAPGHMWTVEERAAHVAKLEVAEEERRLILQAWSRDPTQRPPLTAFTTNSF